jgi:hypothetical protein
MRCPACKKEFEPRRDLTQGKHEEHTCECGQLLQWDYASVLPTRGGLRFGPPGPCEHQDLGRPGALVPLA